ncbi:hypothetical protein P2318_09530 [Myxococcaceae bacterium GXIMD 01537]
MKPLQALRAGTLAGAQYPGLDGAIGSLEEAMLADLNVLGRNQLNELGSHPRQREKLLFEVNGNEEWGLTTSTSVHHDED